MASVLKRLSLILLLSSSAQAATWFSDGSDTSVQALHNQAATVDGDTVSIPAGTFTWVNGIATTKAITIQGQTTVSGDHTTWFSGTYPTNKPTFNDQTIIVDAVPAATNKACIATVNSTATGTMTLNGIAFRGTGTHGNAVFSITIAGTSRKNRVTQFHDIGSNRSWCFGVFANGVIDHSYFDPKSNVQEFENRARVGAWGDEEFAAPAGYGTDNAWYIEDCYAENNISPVNVCGGSDRNNGAATVWRYCFLHNTEIVDHGTYSGRRRGGRWGEDYNNVYWWDSGVGGNHVNGMDGITSGSIYYHDNVFKGPDNPGGWNLRNYRTFSNTDPNWGGAGGNNPWDINVTRANGTHVDGEAPFSFYGPDTVTAETHPTCPNGNGSIMTLTVAGTPWVTNQWAGYTAVRSPTTPSVNSYIGQIVSNTSNQLTMRWYVESCAGFPVGSTFQIYKLLGPALDQPGMGQGDLISPATPPVPPAVGVGIHQQVEPCYSCNNFYEPGHIPINFGVLVDSAATIIQNLHFFNNTCKPGYTPFTYPHPLVGGPTPTPTATATGTPTATPTATATATATPTATPCGLLDNLYAYYKLDEASGSGATDSVGSKNLTNQGASIGSASGVINTSRSFSGTSGSTLSRFGSTTDFFVGANNFSFSFWVYINAYPPSVDAGLLNRYEPSGQREYIVFLNQSTHTISFNIDSGDGLHSAGISWPVVPVLGQWYYVAGGWDGSNIKLSVNNGTFVTAPWTFPMINGGDIFKLGYEAATLNGRMDELAFWIGKCLTQSEVNSIYNAGAGLPYESFCGVGPTPTPSPTPTATATATATATPTATATVTPTATPNRPNLPTPRQKRKGHRP